MSRAFVRESDQDTESLPERVISPHPNFVTSAGLRLIEEQIRELDAALACGTDLYLYLIDDGVRALDDGRLAGLPARGARLFVCAYGCQKRRIPLDAGDRVTYCGLVVLTDLINNTDRFVALN